MNKKLKNQLEELAKYTITSDDLGDIRIPKDFDVGHKYKDDKDGEYVSVPSYRKHKGKRVLNMAVQSWAGVSIGATHLYGDFSTYSTSFKILKLAKRWSWEEYGVGDTISISGAGDQYKPIITQGIKIKISTPITKENLEVLLEDDPDNKSNYRVGMYTTRMLTAEEFLEAAVNCFVKNFDIDKWIIGDDYFFDEYKIDEEYTNKYGKYFKINHFEE